MLQILCLANPLVPLKGKDREVRVDGCASCLWQKVLFFFLFSEMKRTQGLSFISFTLSDWNHVFMCSPLQVFKRVYCVCVCHTLDKGSHPTTFTQAGDGDTCIASPSTKLAIHGEDISSGRGTDVPAFNTMTPLVHPAAVRCFHGPSCYHPPNRFLSAAAPPI